MKDFFEENNESYNTELWEKFWGLMLMNKHLNHFDVLRHLIGADYRIKISFYMKIGALDLRSFRQFIQYYGFGNGSKHIIEAYLIADALRIIIEGLENKEIQHFERNQELVRKDIAEMEYLDPDLLIRFEDGMLVPYKSCIYNLGNLIHEREYELSNVLQNLSPVHRKIIDYFLEPYPRFKRAAVITKKLGMKNEQSVVYPAIETAIKLFQSNLSNEKPLFIQTNDNYIRRVDDESSLYKLVTLSRELSNHQLLSRGLRTEEVELIRQLTARNENGEYLSLKALSRRLNLRAPSLREMFKYYIEILQVEN